MNKSNWKVLLIGISTLLSVIIVLCIILFLNTNHSKNEVSKLNSENPVTEDKSSEVVSVKESNFENNITGDEANDDAITDKENEVGINKYEYPEEEIVIYEDIEGAVIKETTGTSDSKKTTDGKTESIIQNEGTENTTNQNIREKEPLEDIGEIYYKDFSDDDIEVTATGIEYVKNQVLISGFCERKDKREVEEIAKELKANVVGYIELTNDYQVEFNENMSYDDLLNTIAYLENYSVVSSASLNYVTTTVGAYKTSDKMYSDNRHAEIMGGETVFKADSNPQKPDSMYDSWDGVGGDNWGLEALNVPVLWNHKAEFAPVRVGIYDTGFLVPDSREYVAKDIGYEHILGNNDDRYPYIENDIKNNQGKEKMDHGTLVAGVLAALHDNGEGISGIPTDTRLYAYELKGNGKESFMGEKYAFALLIGNHVKVINYSRGNKTSESFIASKFQNSGAADSIRKKASLLEEYLNKFIIEGYEFVIVVSAGNDYNIELVYDNNTYREATGNDSGLKKESASIIDVKYASPFCAIDPNSSVGRRIIVVGALNYKYEDATGKTTYFRTDFTNRGERVDFYAPGERILTLAPKCRNEELYCLARGTSVAAPFVSGIVAAMYQANPNMHSRYVKEYIRLSCNSFVENGETILMPDAEKCYQMAVQAAQQVENDSALPTGIVAGTITGIEKQLGTERVEISAIRHDDGESRLDQNCFIFSADADNDFIFPLPQGEYDLMFSFKGYPPAFVNNIIIEPEESNYIGEVPLQQLANSNMSYYVLGSVQNALDGELVPDVCIRFRKGWNSYDGSYIVDKSGKVIQSFSDGDGYFEALLLQGIYTAEVCKGGYVTGYFNVVSTSQNSKEIDLVITPLLEEDEYRIVLTWGDEPKDLDSHLTCYVEDEQIFHLAYDYPEVHIGKEVVATLDLDDQESYGPETVTVKYNSSFVNKGGTFSYSVHNYSDSSNNESMNLSLSDAVVRVYRGNSLLSTYYAPKKNQGTVWHVFDIDVSNTNKPLKSKNEFYSSESQYVR